MARFALKTSWDSFPTDVKAESVRALVNWVACAVKGVMITGSSGDASLIGRRERVGVPDAALIACISSTAHTFDDTHLATITHPIGAGRGQQLPGRAGRRRRA